MTLAGGGSLSGVKRQAKALERGFEACHDGTMIGSTFMRRRAFGVKVLIGLTLLSALGCGKEPAHTLQGIASWYGYPHHGRLTASGRRFDMYQLTAAHRTLPLGTRLRVTNLNNGRSVTVTITDRGPFVKDRVIDLSYAAAWKIGMIGPGTAPVRLEILG